MFWFMVISIAFTLAAGNKVVLRLEHSQHFETQAVCEFHLPAGLVEVKQMVNHVQYPVPEAKTGTFTSECVKGVEERNALRS